MIHQKKIYFIFLGVVVLSIFKKNPLLFSEAPLYDKNKKVAAQYIFPTIHWREFSKDGPPAEAIFYRGDIQRQGQFQWQGSSQLKLLWSAPDLNVGVHSASKASPVADETGVYVGSDSSWFYAFNPDGTSKWKFYASESRAGIHSTAALDGSHIYFGTYSGWFYCLEKVTGTLVWSRKLGTAIGASPVIFENSLILSIETPQPNGFVIRLNKETGEEIWISDWLGEQSHSSPVIDLKNRQVLLGANNSFFFSLDLDKGTLRWKVQSSGNIKGTAMIVQDRVYYSDWGSKFWSRDLIDGKPAWSYDLEAGSQTSPSYFPAAQLFSIADKKGNLMLLDHEGKLRWQKKIPQKHFISSAISLLGSENQERILIACEAQFLCFLDLNGKELSRFKLDGVLTGVPFVYQDRIYAAVDRGSLFALQAISEK